MEAIKNAFLLLYLLVGLTEIYLTLIPMSYDRKIIKKLYGYAP